MQACAANAAHATLACVSHDSIMALGRVHGPPSIVHGTFRAARICIGDFGRTSSRKAPGSGWESPRLTDDCRRPISFGKNQYRRFRKNKVNRKPLTVVFHPVSGWEKSTVHSRLSTAHFVRRESASANSEEQGKQEAPDSGWGSPRSTVDCRRHISFGKGSTCEQKINRGKPPFHHLLLPPHAPRWW